MPEASTFGWYYLMGGLEILSNVVDQRAWAAHANEVLSTGSRSFLLRTYAVELSVMVG